eukprot:comp21509_c0_seq1/m.46942 comp21509_c0_seq1/g.46942  ORF comp21509_c0_seq1/g.46942 comp21509_c0_seq1/m.46942 type:complete len:373 (+) comp21509_c0_seq1:386-1504(+)
MIDLLAHAVAVHPAGLFEIFVFVVLVLEQILGPRGVDELGNALVLPAAHLRDEPGVVVAQLLHFLEEIGIAGLELLLFGGADLVLIETGGHLLALERAFVAHLCELVLLELDLGLERRNEALCSFELKEQALALLDERWDFVAFQDAFFAGLVEQVLQTLDFGLAAIPVDFDGFLCALELGLEDFAFLFALRALVLEQSRETEMLGLEIALAVVDHCLVLELELGDLVAQRDHFIDEFLVVRLCASEGVAVLAHFGCIGCKVVVVSAALLLDFLEFLCGLFELVAEAKALGCEIVALVLEHFVGCLDCCEIGVELLVFLDGLVGVLGDFDGAAHHFFLFGLGLAKTQIQVLAELEKLDAEAVVFGAGLFEVA